MVALFQEVEIAIMCLFSVYFSKKVFSCSHEQNDAKKRSVRFKPKAVNYHVVAKWCQITLNDVSLDICEYLINQCNS